MDLSRSQKTERDDVEATLWPLEQILDELAECAVRVDAAMKVWHQTEHTLRPAAQKLERAIGKLTAMQADLSRQWHCGAKKKWRDA